MGHWPHVCQHRGCPAEGKTYWEKNEVNMHKVISMKQLRKRKQDKSPWGLPGPWEPPHSWSQALGNLQEGPSIRGYSQCPSNIPALLLGLFEVSFYYLQSKCLHQENGHFNSITDNKNYGMDKRDIFVERLSRTSWVNIDIKREERIKLWITCSLPWSISLVLKWFFWTISQLYMYFFAAKIQWSHHSATVGSSATTDFYNFLKHFFWSLCLPFY